MAEEFYTVPESPEYNAAAIRKIQDTDPVRAKHDCKPRGAADDHQYPCGEAAGRPEH